MFRRRTEAGRVKRSISDSTHERNDNVITSSKSQVGGSLKHPSLGHHYESTAFYSSDTYSQRKHNDKSTSVKAVSLDADIGESRDSNITTYTGPILNVSSPSDDSTMYSQEGTIKNSFANHHEPSKYQPPPHHPNPPRPRRPRTMKQKALGGLVICALFYIQYVLWMGVAEDTHAATQNFLVGHANFQTILDHDPKVGNIVYDGSNLMTPPEIRYSQATIILKPSLGQHTNSHDAVFGIADGLPLHKIVLFVTTLRESGFFGDIVLSVSSKEKLEAGTWEFLEYHSKYRLIVYEGLAVYEMKKVRRRGDKGIKYVETLKAVSLLGLYMDPRTEDTLLDPRKPRPMDTARYEVRLAHLNCYQDFPCSC